MALQDWRARPLHSGNRAASMSDNVRIAAVMIAFLFATLGAAVGFNFMLGSISQAAMILTWIIITVVLIIAARLLANLFS